MLFDSAIIDGLSHSSNLGASLISSYCSLLPFWNKKHANYETWHTGRSRVIKKSSGRKNDKILHLQCILYNFAVYLQEASYLILDLTMCHGVNTITLSTAHPFNVLTDLACWTTYCVFLSFVVAYLLRCKAGLPFIREHEVNSRRERKAYFYGHTIPCNTSSMRKKQSVSLEILEENMSKLLDEWSLFLESLWCFRLSDQFYDLFSHPRLGQRTFHLAFSPANAVRERLNKSLHVAMDIVVLDIVIWFVR